MVAKQSIDIGVNKAQRSLTTRDLVYVLFRHKWKMLFFFTTVVGFVTVATILSPSIYRSEAKLLLKIGRESVTLDPTADTGPLMHVTQSRRSEINSEIEILRGRDLVEQVIDTIGLESFLSKSQPSDSAKWLMLVKSAMRWPKDVLKQMGVSEQLSDREKVLLGVYNNLYVGSDKDTNIIDISYTAQSPEMAQRIVSELINLSLEKHIAAHRTPGSYEFFVEQTEHLKQKLTASEDKLKSLKNKVGISSIERQQTILQERIRLLEMERDTAESSLAAAVAKVNSLEQSIAQVPETTVLQETTGYPSSGADAMREELFRLQIEEQKLLKNFSEGSRSVESIRKEIARAQDLLKEEQDRTQVTKGLNRSFEELNLALMTEKANKVALQERLASLNQQLQSARQKLAPLNDVEMEISSLLREISTQEANLQKYSENLEQARIDDAMESQRISNISVIQAATFPIKSIRPQKALNLGLGFFLGVFGALILAVVSELMDHTIKTPLDIEEKLRLRSLGYIPRSKAFTLNGKSMTKPVAASKLSRSTLKKSAAPPIGFSIKPQQNYIDLKERLFQSLNGSAAGGYVIGVTSYDRREGVSTVTASLAGIIGSRNAGKVVAIDANTVNPALHKMLGVSLSPGLSDIIRTRSAKDAMKQVNNIRVIPAGQCDEYLSDDLMWERFQSLLSECKKRYAITIVDIPSLRQNAIASKISTACDGVIMVIESEKMRLEVAQDWCRQLASRNVNTIGAVLNKRRFCIPKWIYKTL